MKNSNQLSFDHARYENQPWYASHTDREVLSVIDDETNKELTQLMSRAKNNLDAPLLRQALSHTLDESVRDCDENEIQGMLYSFNLAALQKLAQQLRLIEERYLTNISKLGVYLAESWSGGMTYYLAKPMLLETLTHFYSVQTLSRCDDSLMQLLAVDNEICEEFIAHSEEQIKAYVSELKATKYGAVGFPVRNTPNLCYYDWMRDKIPNEPGRKDYYHVSNEMFKRD